MFACIYSQIVAKNGPQSEPLVDLAFAFSPLVERIDDITVVLDVSGEELLFGSPPLSSAGVLVDIGFGSAPNIVQEISRRATRSGFKVNVAVAANPDAAIHAARSISGVSVIPPGDELSYLGSLSLKSLDYSLAGIDADRAEDIRETLALWGIRTFGDFAGLPLAGVAQRLGQEGVRLQRLAQGKSKRHLNAIQPSGRFEQSLELEDSISSLEPLSFILARLLNQLCANLNAHALATNELRLRLTLDDKTEHERTIALPVPMRNPKTFLRLLVLDLESNPPQRAIVAVMITAEPVKPRGLQNGLFIPLAPEPEKLELTLARLSKLVGAENVGSPELLDTHRPDAFRVRRFSLAHARKKKLPRQKSESNRSPSGRNLVGVGDNRPCVLGFCRFRPPLPAEVQTTHGQPTRMSAPSSWRSIRGRVVRVSGPWRTSGDWWRADGWARDEWDVAVESQSEKGGRANSKPTSLYRVYRDLRSEEWFVEGMYD